LATPNRINQRFVIKKKPSAHGREGENASILGSRSWLLASTTDGDKVSCWNF